MAFKKGETIVIEQLNLLNERYDVRPLLEFVVTDEDNKYFYAVRKDGNNDTVRRFDKRSKKSKIKFGIYYKAYRNVQEYEEAIQKRNEMDGYITNIETCVSSMNYCQLQQVAEYVNNMVL